MSESQPDWLKRAKETFNIHRRLASTHDKWGIRDTAKYLKRSFGSVTEDITIARFCRIDEERLGEFKYAYEALAFVRKKQRESDLREI